MTTTENTQGPQSDAGRIYDDARAIDHDMLAQMEDLLYTFTALGVPYVDALASLRRVARAIR